MMSAHILLVEGPGAGRCSCAPGLTEKGYTVTLAHSRREAQACLQEPGIDLLILDGRHLRFDAARFCQALRAESENLPVLLILREGEKPERNLGVNAHLREPFTLRKLINRVRRLLPAPGNRTVRLGNVVLDLERRTAIHEGTEHRLTPKQARLLTVFLRHPGQVLTRTFLMKQVWDTDFVGDTRTLEVHIHWLRRALEEDPAHPVYLITVRRMGYCLNIPPSLVPPLPAENR
jgi:DNA-binding response OmpR family regulator